VKSTHEIRIDLYSDVVTKPTAGMREAMCTAEVGDEKGGEDPTVNRLNEIVAELLGKEAALFLPSGTMCNEIAFRVFCRPGDEILMDKTAHSRHYETGGHAALSGATIYPLDGVRGIFSASEVGEAIRPNDPHFPRSRVVVVEQTSNMGGGTIWPLDVMNEACALAKSRGLACHMDGARLLNAVVETGISAKEYAAEFDSVWIDFSKGLGAPVGAGLAGSKEFIEEALRWKFQFGGAMRQAGIIAAGAIYALEHHVQRLREDHEKARLLKAGLSGIGGISLEPSETNMVFFDVAGLGVGAWHFNEVLLERGLRISVIGKTRMRAVAHLDVTRVDIEEAIGIIRDVVDSLLCN
jgi:threonine aldolase